MGFLNKLLKGLGFEDEEVEKPVKDKKIKKEKIKTNGSSFASYDLNYEDQKIEKNKIEESNAVAPQSVEESHQSDGGFSIIKVKSQVEVQGIVDKIKNGEKILINLTGMSGTDIIRSLDFLTGAVYALDKIMQKVDGNVYLIQ